jgi:hypothetical protein
MKELDDYISSGVLTKSEVETAEFGKIRAEIAIEAEKARAEKAIAEKAIVEKAIAEITMAEKSIELEKALALKTLEFEKTLAEKTLELEKALAEKNLENEKIKAEIAIEAEKAKIQKIVFKMILKNEDNPTISNFTGINISEIEKMFT